MKGGKRIFLKSIMLFIMLALFVIFASPLAAEDEKFEDNQKLPKSSEKKDDIIDAESSNLSADKSFINLKSFQLAEKKEVEKKKKIDLFQNKNYSLSDLQKSTPKPNKSKKVEKSLYTTSLITLLALNTADYFTTIKALQYKEIKEINPVMRPLVKNPSLYLILKLGVNVYAYYAMQNLFKKNKKVAWLVSVLTNAALSYIVLNNIWQINKVK